MQFLRSILFPSEMPFSKSRKNNNSNQESELKSLRKRVSLLEEENKKSAEAIQELAGCVRNISLILAEFSTDVVTMKSFLSEITRTIAATDTDILTKYSLSSDDDDGGGYLN